MPYTSAQLIWLVNHGFPTAALRDLLERPAEELDGQAQLALGLALKSRGQFSAAREVFEPLSRGDARQSEAAIFALLEIDLLYSRIDEMQERLRGLPQDAESDRARLFSARVLAKKDEAEALPKLQMLASSNDVNPYLRRLAAFDAVNLLDESGQYKAALDLANQFHRTMAGGSSPRQLVEHLDLQIEAINQGVRPLLYSTEIPPTAFVVGLPRSGTTLLEQMLDNHSKIGGIGEFDGLNEVIHTMTSQEISPYQFSRLPQESQDQLRNVYCAGARMFLNNSVEWTLDKTLLSWNSIPFLAEFLSKARFIFIQRDPRDVAISVLLSWFDYGQHPWTTSLRDIYEIVYRAQALLPRCLRHCGLEHVTIRYEDLIAAPETELKSCLRLLGLEFEGATATPELNQRVANTLSYNQVKRSLYSSSVGRWKNYEWLFDQEWHRLAEAAGY